MAAQAITTLAGLTRVAGPFVVPLTIASGTSQTVANLSTLVSASAKFRLMEFAFGSDTACTLTWSSSGGDNITGAYPVAANSGVTDKSDHAVGICDANESLALTASVSISGGGRAVYDQVI